MEGDRFTRWARDEQSWGSNPCEKTSNKGSAYKASSTIKLTPGPAERSRWKETEAIVNGGICLRTLASYTHNRVISGPSNGGRNKKKGGE